MSSIEIRKISITELDTDAIVNAANEGLWAGGGVCGAIFRAAGYDRLQDACDAIGHCDTGSAVITASMPASGISASCTIRVSAKDLTGIAEIAEIPEQVYNGGAHRPAISVSAYRVLPESSL